MKVKELIEELNKLDQDKEIVANCIDGCGWSNIKSPLKVELSLDGKTYVWTS